MTPNEKGFNFGGNQILGSALRHQINTKIPRFLKESAAKTIYHQHIFFANSLAGTWEETIDVNFNFYPFAVAIKVAEVDKDPTVLPIIDDQARTLTCGIVGGSLSMKTSKTAVTVTAITLNVGWPSMVTAYVVIYLFNDDVGLAAYGF